MKVLILFVFIGIAHSSIIPPQVAKQDLSAQLQELGLEDFELLKAEAAKLKVPDMVIAEGYPVEDHYITTPDGYILNVHRIPHGKSGQSNGKVAYLQHGVLASSSDWIIQGAAKSLGYILADEGYDVWMGNVRGNAYSRNHTSFNPDTDEGFWLFSWHQIGVIDVPTIIDYVLAQTGADSLYYAGHSQGTTVFYVMTSSLPEYNDKIKAHVSLAPIGFMNHMTSPLMRIMAVWEKPLNALTALIGMDEFLPSDGFLSMMIEGICQEGVGQLLCKNSLFALCGFSPKQMNTTLLPTVMAHTPAGSATKQFLHYAQEINSGKFRQYDWGTLQNIKDYKSLSPPNYDLSKITAPVYLIHSRNDWLAGEKDVERLCTGLGNCAAKLLLSDYTFNHLDFTFGIDAATLVYSKVVSIFSRH
ncbi:lipase 3 [Anoplophora glabripennis]|uniref:lipase 3 n=1 Tax=Anoplophora glabripennis TaxID=217634 RepID=UPI000874941E|nr:lipase 3 [Anoplophora glabripennis]